jgi:cell division protein FtsQ
MLTSPFFSLQKIEIKGLKELTEKDIFRLTEIRRAQNLLTLNLERSLRHLQDEPWIREVSISRFLPDRLVISITEYQAKMVLMKEGHFYLVDETGKEFKKLSPQDNLDLPVINGWTPAIQSSTGLSLAKMIEIKNSYTAKMGVDFPGNLSEIHVDEFQGVTLFTDRGILVALGLDDYDLKMVRLRQLWDDLASKGMGQGQLRVDLSDPDKATVEPRDPKPKRIKPADQKKLKA